MNELFLSRRIFLRMHRLKRMRKFSTQTGSSAIKRSEKSNRNHSQSSPAPFSCDSVTVFFSVNRKMRNIQNLGTEMRVPF